MYTYMRVYVCICVCVRVGLGACVWADVCGCGWVSMHVRACGMRVPNLIANIVARGWRVMNTNFTCIWRKEKRGEEVDEDNGEKTIEGGRVKGEKD